MVIALIVNREGFPFSYETFDGNRADVSTMESILRMVERKYGKARRIWVMDRGIVSEENLAAIRKRGGHYLVGTPRRQMKRFEAELLKDDWTQVRADVEVKQIAIPQGEETYILCRTAGRKEKEKAIRKRFSLGMEKALEALKKSIASGRLKDRYKMERRLGRIQARHPQVNDLFEVTLRDTPAGVRLLWEMKKDREAWRDLREGAYMLRTNLQADSAEQLKCLEANAGLKVSPHSRKGLGFRCNFPREPAPMPSRPNDKPGRKQTQTRGLTLDDYLHAAADMRRTFRLAEPSFGLQDVESQAGASAAVQAIVEETIDRHGSEIYAKQHELVDTLGREVYGELLKTRFTRGIESARLRLSEFCEGRLKLDFRSLSNSRRRTKEQLVCRISER
jgi:hypothetical protein